MHATLFLAGLAAAAAAECAVCETVAAAIISTYADIRVDAKARGETLEPAHMSRVAMSAYCAQPKLGTAIDKVCYNLEPMKLLLSTALSQRVTPKRLCKRAVAAYPDMCDIRQSATNDAAAAVKAYEGAASMARGAERAKRDGVVNLFTDEDDAAAKAKLRAKKSGVIFE